VLPRRQKAALAAFRFIVADEIEQDVEEQEIQIRRSSFG